MTVVPPDPAHVGAPDVQMPPKRRAVVNPAQCRAARAWIGWTQGELAHQAGLTRKTVADFENGTRSLHYRSRRTITTALESAGAVFLWEDDSEGVAFRERPTSVP